jgi:CBS domain-containing protein
MRVQDVMTRKVKTVSAATHADEAWALMRMKGIHHLVVLEGRDIAGVISDRDLGGPHGGTVRDSRLVSELMTENVVTIGPEVPIRRVANLLRGKAIGCLVVVQEGRVKGIVTTADLLELIGRGTERPIVTTQRRIISHRVPHRKHQASGVW